MGRRVVLAVCAALVAVCAVALIRTRAQQWSGVDGAREQRTRAVSVSAGTEQEWIVRQVLSSVVALTGLQRRAGEARPLVTVTTDPLAAGNPLRDASFAVTVAGSAPEHIAVVEHIWSVKTYAPFARARLQATAPAAQSSEGPADAALISALTTPTTAVLLAQNRVVSADLLQHLDSASAHDRAAILLATLALREPPSDFTDIRPTLSRMSAHLAIASALRGAAGRSRTAALGEILLTLLAGDQREALNLLTNWKKDAASDAERAWARAIAVRATSDWRLIDRADSATLIEQLEYGRALNSCISSSRYLEFLDEPRLTPMTDWHAIAAGNGNHSIAAAHRLVPSGVDEDLDESRQVWSAFHTGEFRLADLNDEPAPGGVEVGDRGFDVQVLDWGLWAGFLQRHLVLQLAALGHYYVSLGDTSAGRALPSKLETRFRELALYPAILRMIAPDAAEYHRSIELARPLAISQPQRLTPRVWKTLIDKPYVADKPDLFPSDMGWFTPLVPAGTAFDLSNRSMREYCERPAPLSDVERWAAMRPYDEWVIWGVVWRRSPGMPTIAEAQRAFGSLVEYNTTPLLRMLGYMRGSIEEYTELAGARCKLDADYCGDFGGNLLIAGREKEAVAAYERWIESGRDQVRIANGLTWLVRYYYDNDKKERAIELASMAGDAYSAAGLELWAETLDRAGRHREAEETLHSLADRYEGATSQLGTFYLRQARRTSDAAYLGKGLPLVSRVFPKGLEQPPADALPAPPVDGIILQRVGARGERLGLRANDIITMVDGIRIRNMDQYYIASRLSFDNRMSFVVWRADRYHRLEIVVPERWMGVRFATYPATSQE